MTSDEIYVRVGVKIKELATKRKMTLKDFAIKRMRCSPSYLSQIIHGYRKPGRKYVLMFLEMGMNKQDLDIYDGLNLDPNQITINELITIIKEQRRQLEFQSEQIKQLSKTLLPYVKRERRNLPSKK